MPKYMTTATTPLLLPAEVETVSTGEARLKVT